MELLNYKFVSREVTVNEIIQNKMRNIKVVMIGVLEEHSGIVYPHPITHFIKTMYEYSGKSLNSTDVPAKVVCRLLNYCLNKVEENHEDYIELKQIGLRGLKRKHASGYITHLSLKGLQKSTVEQYEYYLTAFFVYLKKMNLINEEFEIDERKNAIGNTTYKSIFRAPHLGTRFPSQETKKTKVAKLKDFGDDRVTLTSHFISIAMKVAPEIALGLCFQFYGGLRRGEVVNIDRGGLIVRRGESMEVQIKDNRRKFFSRLKDTKSENPKRLNYLGVNLSRQTVLDNDLVWSIYDKHMRSLDSMLLKGKCKNINALFIDKDGYPMSGKVYDRRFKKVKKAFLISIMGHEDYDLLADTVWSTHIGRGVFTNTLIDMGFTPTQLAIARGDRNINSALAYIDANLTTEQIKEAVNEFKKHPIERLGLVDFKYVKRWKERVG
ncbi:site-specific integrase [Halalkalibacter alkaliphilus]|uniref:Site-specific integrase n=1 Tax=Halalkalibacter alkaliphilus TaxID=2917993 RepID=A0A9X2CRV5_9BACI|nr:site-specific integrase [Halalkalibacter alkaliphilus]MCL7747049.1 site-specific integrase [Halalkalibacter alkaliphilus]